VLPGARGRRGRPVDHAGGDDHGHRANPARPDQTSAPGGAAPGFFPVELDHAEQLAEVVADLAALRREAGTDPTEPYDVVVALPPGSDPAPYVAAGASWWLVEFPWDAVSVDQVRAVIRDGPAAPA
jgi:hypothetical protein